MKSAVLTRAQEILNIKSSGLSEQIKQDLAAGRLAYTDLAFYIASPISGGLNESFGSSTVSESLGRTNVDEGRFPQDILVTKIKVELATHTAAITEATAKDFVYSNVIDKADADAAILNGEIEVKADGATVLNDMPLAKFFSIAGTSFADANGSVCVELETPILFKKGQKWENALRIAGTPTATGNALKVTVEGVGFRMVSQ